LAIWGALPGFRGECSERTFFFRIAHNRALAHVARRRLPVAESETLPEVEDATPDPEKTLSGEQQGQLLMAAIRRLPVAHAQVVTLMLEGMTYQEIADVLGISETNVGARLTRGREMLRRLLRNANAG
jgi:RNA polymerase sigma-70 factor (ECF subfamily)